MTTHRLARLTGLLGLLTVVLLFGPTIAVSTLGEPAFVTTPAAAQAFFSGASADWAQLTMAVTGIAGIAIVWFVAGLTTLLHRREPGLPWLSITALGSGLLVAGYAILDSSWEAAAFGAADLDPSTAQYAFDTGNLAFAGAWLAVASLAISLGWTVISTRCFARWLGWSAILCGLGLVASRFSWTSGSWLLPYALFWVWVIVVSIQLIARPSRMEVPSSGVYDEARVQRARDAGIEQVGARAFAAGEDVVAVVRAAGEDCHPTGPAEPGLTRGGQVGKGRA